jgi:hypothetical protein
MDVSSVAACVAAHITLLLCGPPAITVGLTQRERSVMAKTAPANKVGEWHYHIINVPNNNRFHNTNAQPQGMERINNTPANSAAHGG